MFSELNREHFFRSYKEQKRIFNKIPQNFKKQRSRLLSSIPRSLQECSEINYVRFVTSRTLKLFSHPGHWHFSHITNFDTFRTPTLLVWIRENVPEVHIPDSAIPSSSSNASLSCSSWGWRSSFSLPSSTANRHWKREQDAEVSYITKTHTGGCRCKPNPTMMDADVL